MDVDQYISSANDFIVRKQKANGSWSDFNTLAGESTQWTTAFVANVLCLQNNDSLNSVANKGLNYLLKRQFWRRGWSYNAKVPVDADSTIWTILLARSLKREGHWRIKKAISFLHKCQAANGGITTFPRNKEIRFYTKLNSSISFKGWCKDHICVSAAAIHLDIPFLVSLENYLLARQEPEGYWKSYWWDTNYYATCLVIEAFSKRNLYPLVINLGTTWARSQLKDSKSHSSFNLALLLRILLCDKLVNSEEANSIVFEILNRNKSKGGWEGDAPLRIPPPYVEKPETYSDWTINGKGGGSINYDHKGLFTSSVVLEALLKYKTWTVRRN